MGSKLLIRRLPDANLEVSFRPRGFSPPRRFSPRCGSQACCILLPIVGFASFHTDLAEASRDPRDATTPRRILPTTRGSPVTRSPCPLGVRSRRARNRPLLAETAARETVVFEALFVWRVCNVDARCRAATPCPSWACMSSSRSHRNRGRTMRPRRRERWTGPPAARCCANPEGPAKSSGVVPESGM